MHTAAEEPEASFCSPKAAEQLFDQLASDKRVTVSRGGVFPVMTTTLKVAIRTNPPEDADTQPALGLTDECFDAVIELLEAHLDPHGLALGGEISLTRGELSSDGGEILTTASFEVS